MLSDFLKANLESQASYVEYGFGQVEPNHLSAQRTSQVYAQLPANKDIEMLEQGQFVKYDYGCVDDEGNSTPEVNFKGAGEWMLVYNEIKLYREHQLDCEFAMIADNYQARIYSPYDYKNGGADKQARWFNGKDANGEPIDDVTAGPDLYEMHYNEDPFHFEGAYKPRSMGSNVNSMVPRVFKTNVGDIFTTNTINADPKAGDVLYVGANGILTNAKAEAVEGKFAGSGNMEWQVVKVYTMPDGQRGVKVMRIQ